MVIRPSIEKWSRPELEDRYHTLYQQHYNLKRSYNEVDNKLKQYAIIFHCFSILFSRQSPKEQGLRSSEVYSLEYEDLE